MVQVVDQESYEHSRDFVEWLCRCVYESVINPTPARRDYCAVEIGIHDYPIREPIGMNVESAFKMVKHLLEICAKDPGDIVRCVYCFKLNISPCKHRRAHALDRSDYLDLKERYLDPLRDMRDETSAGKRYGGSKNWSCPKRLAEGLAEAVAKRPVEFVTGAGNEHRVSVYAYFEDLFGSYGLVHPVTERPVTERALKEWVVDWHEKMKCKGSASAATKLFMEHVDTVLRGEIEKARMNRDGAEFVRLVLARYAAASADENFAKAVKHSNVKLLLEGLVQPDVPPP